jgi:hypothetical protein
LNSSYQIFNAHKILELYEYTYDNFGSGHVNNRVLTGPKWFQARHAPISIKELANNSINKLLQKQWLDDREFNMIQDCQKVLNHDQDKLQWNVFKKQCKFQDDFRGVHLKDYDSTLAKEVYS